MKFKIGDETDIALCIALKHEFLRCDDAFKDFAESATIMIMQGENRRIAYKTYNAYARFVLHLYEFMMGAAARDFQNTKQLDTNMAERYVARHTQLILTNKREAILNGTAPAWENHISAYPEKIPQDFAKKFREYRNSISGHIIINKAHLVRSNLSLSDFYDKYHMCLYLLYRDVQSWWGRQHDEFPDLKEITAFSVLIKDDMPPQL